MSQEYWYGYMAGMSYKGGQSAPFLGHYVYMFPDWTDYMRGFVDAWTCLVEVS